MREVTAKDLWEEALAIAKAVKDAVRLGKTLLGFAQFLDFSMLDMEKAKQLRREAAEILGSAVLEKVDLELLSLVRGASLLLGNPAESILQRLEVNIRKSLKKMYAGNAWTARCFDEDLEFDRPYVDQPDAVQCVAFTPDGRLLAMGVGNKGDLYLCDVKQRRVVHGKQHHGDSLNRLAFSPGGHFLASAGWQETVHIWRVSKSSTLEPQVSLQARARKRETGYQPTIPAPSIAFSADGAIIATCVQGGNIDYWNVQNGALLGTSGADVYALATLPTTSEFISGNADGTLSFWRCPEGRLTRTINNHDRLNVLSLVTSANGGVACTINANSDLSCWNLRDGSLLFKKLGMAEPSALPSQCVSITPDGSVLALAKGRGSSAPLCLIPEGKWLPQVDLGLSGFCKCVAFSPDGGTLAIGARVSIGVNYVDRLYLIHPPGSKKWWQFWK